MSKAFLKPVELSASPNAPRLGSERCGHHIEHNFFQAIATDLCGNNRMNK